MFLSNTYLWLVRLAVSWGNFVPVHESPLFQRIIRLSKCLYVPLDGADLAYAELWATPAERVIRYSEGTDKADPAGFLAQFFSCIRHRVLQIETAKPSGFAGGRKLWGCFFPFSLSLKQAFLSTSREPENLRKVCFRHINTQCFRNEICSPDAAASQRNWWSCQFCHW